MIEEKSAENQFGLVTLRKKKKKRISERRVVSRPDPLAHEMSKLNLMESSDVEVTDTALDEGI